ncbi:Rho GTPase-activating protein [Oopsacas minuta]|uniref:Rho GTPase-activating protein n=1 Tax=Oopsacas minuta TaxID=111878 RepID=A0AAV7JBA5_9METZ|nr:Rho GTPase-activating protein [Oopsacas minuta]
MSYPSDQTGEGSQWNGTALLAQSGNKRMIITPSARASLKSMDQRVGAHEMLDDTTSITSGISITSQGILAGNVYRVGGLTRELVERLQESEREGSLAALPPNIDYIELKPGDAPPKGFAWEAHSKKKGKPRINLIPESIRKIAGIRSVSEKSLAALGPSLLEEGDTDSAPWDSNTKQMFLRQVEIWKAPGDTLGFYVSRGDGHERSDGVFLSRLVLGSYVERLGLLQVGDEILAINGIPVGDMPLQNVVMLLKYVQRLELTVKAPSGWSHLYRKFNKRPKPSRKAPPVPSAPFNHSKPILTPFAPVSDKSRPTHPHPQLVPFPSVSAPVDSRQRSSSSTDPPTEPIVPPSGIMPIHSRGFSDISMPNPVSYRPVESDFLAVADHQHSLSSTGKFQYTGRVNKHYLHREPEHLLNAEQLEFMAQLEREEHLFESEDTTQDTQHVFVDHANIDVSCLPVVLPLDVTDVIPVIPVIKSDDSTHTDTEQDLDSTPPLLQLFPPDHIDTDQESVPTTEVIDSESNPDFERADTPSIVSINLSREGSIVELPPLHDQLADVPQDDQLLPKIYIK